MVLSDTIARLTTGTYSVSRPNASDGYDSNGEATVGAATTFNVVGVAQPVMDSSDSGIQALAEGRNVRDLYELRTTTALQERDTVTVNSESWEVLRVKIWTLRGDTHYSAILARQEIPG